MKKTWTTLTVISLLLTSTLCFPQSARKIINETNYKGVILSKEVKIGYMQDSLSRWMPDENGIHVLEKLLLSFLIRNAAKKNEQYHNYQEVLKKLPNYIRQYIGYITAKGEKMMFVNFLLSSKNDEVFLKGWDKKFIIVFDGGTSFWRIHYDVGKNKFSGFNVNGVA